MRRTLVGRIPGRRAVTKRPHPFEQRPAQLLEIHDTRLLARHDLVEFVEKLVLMRKPRLEVNEAFFAHPGHLCGRGYSGRIHASIPD